MAEKRKRTFKPRVDLLRSMTAAELQVRFWFNQDGIGFIANLVCDFNGPPTNINYSVPAHVQVMVTLRYFATVRKQPCSGDNFGFINPQDNSQDDHCPRTASYC